MDYSYWGYFDSSYRIIVRLHLVEGFCCLRPLQYSIQPRQPHHPSGAFVSIPLYFFDSDNFSHGANTFLLFFRTSSNSGKCRTSTSFIPLYCTHWKPSLVYVSVFHCPAMKRSLFSRLLAMRIKIRKAVSLNPKPSGTGSLCEPTSVSTCSMSP